MGQISAAFLNHGPLCYMRSKPTSILSITALYKISFWFDLTNYITSLGFESNNGLVDATRLSHHALVT